MAVLDLFGLAVRDARGTTAVEYALVAGLIAVVIVVAITATGTGVENLFNSIVVNY
ncbi:MAG: Flp family type IVb pilin [Alphaproteobacteria bacterium]|nr:Flp family type IVb pilin [Alphaproteobacteria bacterium]